MTPNFKVFNSPRENFRRAQLYHAAAAPANLEGKSKQARQPLGAVAPVYVCGQRPHPVNRSGRKDSPTALIDSEYTRQSSLTQTRPPAALCRVFFCYNTGHEPAL
jgi:hypothetical protein